jgi:IPT/TIG domain
MAVDLSQSVQGTGTGSPTIKLASEAPAAGPTGDLPYIKSITPKTGLLGGGNLVVIDGDNFTSVRKVLFGDVEAVFEHAWTPGNPRLKVIVPAGSKLGSVPVSVVTDSGPSTGTSDASAYTYVAVCPTCLGSGLAKA